jgi:hypothetical protein
MFEHIALRRADRGNPISAGQIAEALLYYRKVHFFMDRGTLLDLIKQLGLDRTLMLLRRPELTAVYCEESLGTHTESVGVTQFHRYVAFYLSGDQKVGELKTPSDRLLYDLRRQGASSKDARRFAREFLDRVPIRKLSGDHYLKGGIVAAAQADVSDRAYLAKAIRVAARTVPGGYDPGDNFAVEVIDTDKGTVVFAELDIAAINARRAKAPPPDNEPVTIAHMLSNVLDARADLALASFYGGDFVTAAVTSAIIQMRYAEVLRRSNLNTIAREHFVEVVLPDSPRLAEVIDAGEQSFDEFLKLLDKAERFKDWLGKVNPDEGLVRTYLRDVSSRGWIERLPAKSLRYLLTTGIEHTNPVAGIVAGLMDNFLVEKLFAGWRPNHFVNGNLGPFLQGR